MNNNKDFVKRLIFGIIKSSLVALVIYLLSITLIRFIATSVGGGDADAGMSHPIVALSTQMILYLAFQIPFYFLYTVKESNYRKVKSAQTFDIKEDFLDFVKGDGKTLMIVFGVLAVVMELSLLIGIPPVSTALLMTFSFCYSVTIPILRIVVAYALTVGTTLLTSVYRHYKEFEYWNK